MAGHSQFKNIMHRKGAQDKKRAQQFAKLGREIIVAAKSGGPDPEANSRLRAAMQAARAANMPKDNVERAIKRATGEGSDVNYEEVRYEGYGPGGVAVMVEALTDNRNRTAAEVRTIFSKNGGSLGETNSVSFQFERVGEILAINPGIDVPAGWDYVAFKGGSAPGEMAGSWYLESETGDAYVVVVQIAATELEAVPDAGWLADVVGQATEVLAREG